MSPATANFQWVTRRHECSLSKVFETIKLGVESDLKLRNGQLTQGYIPFEMATEANAFSVFKKTARAHFIRKFEQTETSIKVTDEIKKTAIIEATLTLDNEGECRLKANDKEYEFWQFRRAALESLLFDTVG